MRSFNASTRSRSFNDENSSIASKFKSSVSSKLYASSNSNGSNVSNSQRPPRARIGLNERASIHTLDPSVHSLGQQQQHRNKKFEVYEDRAEARVAKDASTSQSKYRKPLAERLVEENIVSDDADIDYKKYDDSEDEIDDDVVTLDDIDQIDEDEDLDIDDEEEEEEEDDDDDDEYDEEQPMSPKWNSKIYAELQRVIAKFSRDEPDEEDEDTNDISMVAEYSNEIFNYMHELEARLTPNGKYMDQQDELEWSMRSTLVGWLVQVHQRFNLLPETLFLTINYMDRFLSKRKVSLSRFQLVGAVALFIAAKYEEINCPSIQEIAYMVDHAYSVEDLLKAEKFMIGILEFEMGWPGPMSFLRRTSKADDYDFETRTLAKYFLEITIMDARFVASPPSWLAAGAHYLSRRLLSKGDWTEAHVYYSGYTEDQLRPLADVLINLCQHPVKNHNAIYEKYQERRYRRSATFVQEWFEAVKRQDH